MNPTHYESISVTWANEVTARGCEISQRSEISNRFEKRSKPSQRSL